MFQESRMCLQTIHYVTKGEIMGMTACSCNSNLSIQVATVFALEPCDNLVWRTSQYFQNMLWSVIYRLKDLVLPSHSNL